MLFSRRGTVAALALALGLTAQVAPGQNNVEYEMRDGVRYQVTRRVVQRQVPTTVMEDRQQTVYTQQVTTDNITHQQLCCVPVTQYQMDSRLRGRWNPLVTPYWTHSLKPVTTWHQQLANVQVPVNRVAWVPQTKTVQVPVTAYRPVEEEVITRMAMNGQPSTIASSQPLSGSTPTIAVQPSAVGGVVLDNDPPRQATGWRSRRY